MYSPKKFVPSNFGRGDYQCPHCASICHVPIIPFKGQTVSFIRMCTQGIYIFGETQKSFQDVTGVVYCPKRTNENCVYFSTKKVSENTFLDCEKWKPGATCLIFYLSDKNQHKLYSVEMPHISRPGKQVVTTKPKNYPPCNKTLCVNHNQPNPNLNQKRQNSICL